VIRTVLIAASALLAACQSVEPAVPSPGDQTCDIEVSFGSFASGPDQALKTRIDTFLSGNWLVLNVTETRWGREGESSLCVKAVDAAGTDELYRTLAGWIPDTSRTAPTTVRHRDGRTRTAQWAGPQ